MNSGASERFDKNVLRDQLGATLQSTAAYTFVFDRQPDDQGKDHFDIEVKPVQPSKVAGTESISFLPAEMMAVAPNGGTWLEVLDRLSYYVIPFSASNRDWVCIGLEYVVPHISRNAYPLSYGYIYPFDGNLPSTHHAIADAVEAVAKLSAQTGTHHPIDLPAANGEIIRPALDASLDAAMLRQTATQYRKGIRIFLRTLLLRKEMHPQSISQLFTLPQQYEVMYKNSNQFLIGKPEQETSNWERLRRLLPKVSGPIILLVGGLALFKKIRRP